MTSHTVNSSPRFTHSWASYLLLAVVMVGALWLRVAAQKEEPLWLDELHTAWIATGPWSDVAARAQIGNQSPTYFYLARGSVSLGGAFAWVLRLPSMIAGLLLLPAVFFLTRQMASSEFAALLATLLVAIDSSCVFFAQEARPYALVQLLAVVSVFAFLRVGENPDGMARCVFIGSLIAMFYTHYTSLLVVVSLAIAREWMGRTIVRNEPVWKYDRCRASIDLAMVGLAMLPASWQLVGLVQRRENWWSFISPPNFFDTLLLTPIIPCIVVPALVTLLAQASGRTPFDRKQRDLLMLALLWALLPVIFVSLATALRWAPLFHCRYVVGSLVAPAVAAACFVAILPTRIWQSITYALVIAVSIGMNGWLIESFQAGEVLPQRNQDWRGAIAWLNERLRNSPDEVFLISGLVEANENERRGDPKFEEYLRMPARAFDSLEVENSRLIPLPHDVAQLRQFLQARQTSQRTTWLLALADEALLNALLEEIDPGDSPKWERFHFGDVVVVKLQR